MFDRLRGGWLSGGAAVLLVLALSGVALGADLVTSTEPIVAVVEPVDTTATFEDLDGDGVDDDCSDEVVADPVAAAAAFEAADLDADGAISVTEAARSGWTGGLNCNHGGYVSHVAAAAEDETGEPEGTAGEADTQTTCEVVAAPEPDEPFDETSSNFHGVRVRWVAGSDAVGGKNCNHGGAVSEAAKKDREAATAARAAAKAERAEAKAERDAAKAERAAARELRAQERDSAKAARPKGPNKDD